jgi:hypothetical protein
MGFFGRLLGLGVLGVLVSSCFAPTGAVDAAAGSCAASGITVYGVWKQVAGYPSNWAYGGTNPSKTQLADSFRVMIVEKGGQMCGVAIVNQGINVDPNKSTVFRATYAHDVETKELALTYTYPSGASAQDVTYSITGCNATPRLTLTYKDGREAVFDVYSRSVSSGQCQNAAN